VLTSNAWEGSDVMAATLKTASDGKKEALFFTGLTSACDYKLSVRHCSFHARPWFLFVIQDTDKTGDIRCKECCQFF
jgi:hypothetical protein